MRSRPDLAQCLLELALLVGAVARIPQPDVRVGEVVPDELGDGVGLLRREALFEAVGFDALGRKLLAVGEGTSRERPQGRDQKLVGVGVIHGKAEDNSYSALSVAGLRHRLASHGCCSRGRPAGR